MRRLRNSASRDGAHPRELLAVEPDRARRRQIERAEDLQERRLADARRADDRDHVAGLEDEVDVGEHRQRLAVVDVRLAELADLDPGATHAATRWSAVAGLLLGLVGHGNL